MAMLAALEYLSKLDVQFLRNRPAFKLEHFKVARNCAANNADAVLLLAEPAH
jgi:hypothetical protein